MAENEKARELVDDEVMEQNLIDRFKYQIAYERDCFKSLQDWITGVYNGEFSNETGLPIDLYAVEYHARAISLICMEVRESLLINESGSDDLQNEDGVDGE